MPRIGLALSGGGNRAALFNLGVFLYLADAGKHREVVSVASVSGGSVTNAYVAQAQALAADDGVAFAERVRPFIERLARGGVLWAWPGTWLYLAALAVGLAAVAVLPWYLPWPPLAQTLLFLVGLLVWARYGFAMRGVICGRAFAALLFSPNGRTTLLRDLAGQPADHVFCATEMHAGEHIYFSGRFVCAYRLGWGVPGDLPLHVAVQASASFPGAFPPYVLPAARHQFRDGLHQPHKLVLLDGGVYDNMAEQWPVGLAGRKRRSAAHCANVADLDHVIVVNASANLPWGSVWKLGLPLLGELLSLKRVIDVLYDNTTAPRRRSLVAEFDAAARAGHSPTGALITIEQSPVKVLDSFAHPAADAVPGRAERARAVLARLEAAPADWAAIALSNTRVATTFSALGPDVSARLLYHAYVTAMALLHTLFDYPLLDIPTLDRFKQLAGGTEDVVKTTTGTERPEA